MEDYSEADNGLKVDSDEGAEEVRAMQEMECWQVENHLKNCNKHKNQ